MIRLLTIGVLFFVLSLLQRQVYKRLWDRNLKVTVSFDRDHLYQGEAGELKEIVENRKKLPLTMLKVKFKTDRHLSFGTERGSSTTDQFYRNDVFRIGGGERVTRTLKFQADRRGYYTIQGAGLVASDLMMTGMFVADVPVSASVYVYPRPYDSREFKRSLTRLNGEVLAKRHLLEDPFEYRGIREYQPFDDIRSVNWKATARTGSLKVNQKNYTALKSVRVFLNLRDDGIMKKEACVEASVSIAAGLCAWFLSQGIQVSCYGNGLDILTGKPVSLDGKAGAGQMEAIYRSFARMDLEKPVADFAEAFEERLFGQAGGSVTCFVAPNQYEDFLALLERYGQAGNEYLWFYPVQGKENPELPPSIAKNVQLIHLDL